MEKGRSENVRLLVVDGDDTRRDSSKRYSDDYSDRRDSSKMVAGHGDKKKNRTI